MTTTLVLASASPARLATLQAAGVEPVVVVSGVDESQVTGLAPAELALQLAELKCAAVAERDDLPAAALVLGCDSVLELDGEALGKPGDADDATRRWQAMRGRTGVLHSGHSLRDTGSGHVAAATASTRVHFADVTDDEIAAYVATGEPLQVAGAFTDRRPRRRVRRPASRATTTRSSGSACRCCASCWPSSATRGPTCGPAAPDRPARASSVRGRARPRLGT